MPQSTIWKFPLALVDENVIEVPGDHTFLSVGKDAQGRLSAWFVVDPASPVCKIDVLIVGTGTSMPHAHQFLGTVTHGNYVWHFFTSPKGFEAQKRDNLAYVTSRK